MNCVNCGAAPSKARPGECPYCLTAVEVRDEPAAVCFEHIQVVLKSCRSDYYRSESIENLAPTMTLTAGQVGVLAKQFASDYYRSEALENLIPCVADKRGLLLLGTLFSSDYYRSEFIENLGENMRLPKPRTPGGEPGIRFRVSTADLGGDVPPWVRILVGIGGRLGIGIGIGGGIVYLLTHMGG